MSNIVKMENTGLVAMTEQEMMTVLQNSLYPGAAPDSIKLVLGYCKAAGLDPMQKPVHIVPMDVAVKQPNGSLTYTKRDVVMPGIGLYRTQASRTGQYAGVSEPEFGPAKRIPIMRRQYNNATRDDKTFTMVPDGDMEYPEWCKVTVKRIVSGTIVEFTAKEFWLENYATAGKDSTAPNAMWKRRPYAQLAKCAEAQALRKAFPELGSAPTADEMDGKSLDDEFQGTTIDGKTGAVEMPQARSAAQPPAQPAPTTPPAETAGDTTPLSEGERNFIRKKLNDAALGEADLRAKFGCGVDDLTKGQFADVKAWIANPAG